MAVQPASELLRRVLRLVGLLPDRAGRGRLLDDHLAAADVCAASEGVGCGAAREDIAERRPAYRDYAARTPAFFPGLPKDIR